MMLRQIILGFPGIAGPRGSELLRKIANYDIISRNFVAFDVVIHGILNEKSKIITSLL